MDKVISIIETGLIPDFLIRTGIRQLLKKRLSEESINYNKNNHINKFVEFEEFSILWQSEKKKQ